MLDDCRTSVTTLLVETITKIEGMETGSKTVIFLCASGRKFRMWDDSDYGYRCDLQDVVGDPADLIDRPLLMAEDVSSGDESYHDTCVWTFVKFATINGYVTLRWYGSASGYYSGKPSFEEIIPQNRKRWN